jgi:CheY-like chemotaxis protein
VLLIEDDAGVRAAVRRMLERCGYRLLVADDGAAAIAQAHAHAGQIDLVLSDVVMPGGSGPEIVERLRERFPDLPALFMSGYTAHAALPSVLNDSGAHYIQKPFSPEALAKRVRQVLGG